MDRRSDRQIGIPWKVSSFLSVVGLSSAVLGASTTFRVEVPASTPPADLIYIAGDFQAWNPGDPAHALTRQPDGRWEITLTLPDGLPIQYKFTRGNWQTVEKGPNGEEIPNRTHVPQGSETLEHTVANWADQLSTITGHVESFEHPPFLGGRRCWVYLPPNYFTSDDRYPVLYMHDGQNCFDRATSFAGEWEVDEACEMLIAGGEIEPIIVVAIENSAARCVEYTPWPWVPPLAACPMGGGGADIYLQAIRDVLIPEVNLRYRTQTGPANTYMSGSSLGGLISVYAGYAYTSVWGRIAGVSPYYPWANHEMFNYAAAQTRPVNLTHYYQDMGTLEFGFTDQNGNGIDDFIDDLRTMRGIALAQGFVEGVDFLSIEGQDHTHNEYYWALRMPDILRFLIDPCSRSAGDLNGDGLANLEDVPAFIDALLDPGGTALHVSCAADLNGDGSRDGLDVQPFAELVLSP